jgi:hypothetical protein
MRSINPVNEQSPFITFAEASKEALLVGKRMSLPERFRWVEEAEQFSLTLQTWRWQKGFGVDTRLRPLFEARYGPPGRPAPPIRAMVAEGPTPYAEKIVESDPS